jgi:hypothetical protein
MKKSLNDKKEYIFGILKFICHFNLTQLLYIVELLLRLPSSFALPCVGGGSGGKVGGSWVGRSEV